MDRGASHHRRDPGAEHPGAHRGFQARTGGAIAMSVPQRKVEAVQPVAQSAAKIEVRQLNFYYGRLHALKDVSLTLLDRSITAFIGPSGCGKSTLLRVFNRMYSLYPGHRATGEVLLDGQDILAPSVDAADLRFRVGMVF